LRRRRAAFLGGGRILVEHHQCPALERRVALGELDVADECRLPDLVAHFERVRFDPHRLVAVHRKPLPRRLALLPNPRLRGRGQRAGQHKRDPREHLAPAYRGARCDHLPASALSASRLTTTPRVKRITSPEFSISTPLAVTSPLGIFTST